MGRLSEAARGFEQRLTELKCQHQQDLCLLMRGAAASEESAGGGEEREVNTADHIAKKQLAALLAQNDTLEARCQVGDGSRDG